MLSGDPMADGMGDCEHTHERLAGWIVGLDWIGWVKGGYDDDYFSSSRGVLLAFGCDDYEMRWFEMGHLARESERLTHFFLFSVFFYFHYHQLIRYPKANAQGFSCSPTERSLLPSTHRSAHGPFDNTRVVLEDPKKQHNQKLFFSNTHIVFFLHYYVTLLLRALLSLLGKRPKSIFNASVYVHA